MVRVKKRYIVEHNVTGDLVERNIISEKTFKEVLLRLQEYCDSGWKEDYETPLPLLDIGNEVFVRYGDIQKIYKDADYEYAQLHPEKHLEPIRIDKNGKEI